MMCSKVGGAAIACSVLALSGAGVPAASAATSLRMVGQVARMPLHAHLLGPMSATVSIRATVALNPSNASALQNYATAVSTPGSRDYGRYLTVGQFAGRFGAGTSAIRQIERVLRKAGLRVAAVPANHLSVEVTGDAVEAERAFRTELDQVRLAGGRVAFLNADPPALPASIAGYVQGVIGLDNLALPQAQGLETLHRPMLSSHALVPHAIGSGPAPCAEATSDAQGNNGGDGPGYTADEIAGAYGLGGFYQAGDEGAGQTVALLETQPYQATDISTYQACYGLPTTAPNIINVDGGPGAYASGDDDGEAALDIEQVIGLASKATVDVYQGDPNSSTALSDILTAIVSANQAKAISSSYGVCEALTQPASISAENTTLQEAATQGQSFFVSSGDSGSTMCYQGTSQQSSPDFSTSVIDPGAQPFATAVGGTSLCQSSAAGCAVIDDGSYPGESVWNDGLQPQQTGLPNASATGGGVSDQWPMPSYQSGAAASLGVISPDSSKACGNQFCREVPDVAADADPATGYAIYANGGATDGGWGITGGTSAAAPLWAAYTALLNASPTCRGFTLGFENPALYQLAGSSYVSDFHDITAASPSTGQASNNPFFDYTNSDNPNGLYPVGAGYDMATGLGTPIANTLGPALCSLRAPVYAVTVSSPGTQTSIIDKPVSLQVPAGDPGAGTTLSDSATGLPAGLSMSPSGLITGTPTADGTSTVTVTATDQFTNTANTSFTWTVVTPGPPLTLEHLAGLKNGKISLALNVTAGSYAPAITSVKLVLPKGLAFVRKAKLLKKGIKVSSGTAIVAFTFSGHGGSLTLRFTTPQQALVAIRISKAAFAETMSLEKNVRKHKTKRVKVSVLVTDASGLATPFKAVIKL